MDESRAEAIKAAALFDLSAAAFQYVRAIEECQHSTLTLEELARKSEEFSAMARKALERAQKGS